MSHLAQIVSTIWPIKGPEQESANIPKIFFGEYRKKQVYGKTFLFGKNRIKVNTIGVYNLFINWIYLQVHTAAHIFVMSANVRQIYVDSGTLGPIYKNQKKYHC